MALTFDGGTFPGINFDADIDPPRLVAERTHYPGLKGETEKRLGTGGRYIRYQVELFDAAFRDADAVLSFLKKCDRRVGDHGILKETGNITRTFNNVTFEGCKPLNQPIPDFARTLVLGQVVYHCRILLIFYQLTIQDDG